MEENRSAARKDEKRWWRLDRPGGGSWLAPQKGDPCPKCLMDDLDYDTLFRLSCPVCGYVAECGVFT